MPQHQRLGHGARVLHHGIVPCPAHAPARGAFTPGAPQAGHAQNSRQQGLWQVLCGGPLIMLGSHHDQAQLRGKALRRMATQGGVGWGCRWPQGDDGPKQARRAGKWPKVVSTQVLPHSAHQQLWQGRKECRSRAGPFAKPGAVFCMQLSALLTKRSPSFPTQRPKVVAG